jgi:hypothetical protein
VSSGGPRNWRWWSHIARARGPRPGMVVGFPTEFPWGNFWKWNRVLIGDRIYETWGMLNPIVQEFIYKGKQCSQQQR